MTEPESKKAFPLRISPRLFEQIRRWAEADLRSINGQIEYLLSEAVRKRLERPHSASPPDSSANPSPSPDSGTGDPPEKF